MNNLNLKILITAPSLDTNQNVSGISSVVKTIIENNNQVTYLHFIAGRTDQGTSITGRLKDLALGYLDLYKVIKREKIDILHLNLPLNPKSIYRDFLIYQLASILGLKIFVHLHGGKHLFTKPSSGILNFLIRRMLKNAREVAVLSDIEKNSIEELYLKREIHVLPNTIGPEFINKTDKPVNPEKINILFMGRLVESKGLIVILETCRKLIKAKDLNLQFTFCGSGPLQEEVVKLADSCPDKVEYKGAVSGDLKMSILKESDIFLIPSIHGEGLPMALLETMCCGVVPIATTDGSMKQLVRDGETGCIVSKGSRDELFDKITFLATNNEIRQRLSINCRKFIYDNFSLNKYLLNLNQIYGRVIKNKYK
jgi:glycosyltransferase involved in cell wall biosynthesis